MKEPVNIHISYFSFSHCHYKTELPHFVPTVWCGLNMTQQIRQSSILLEIEYSLTW
jgi:hypothetical protein